MFGNFFSKRNKRDNYQPGRGQKSKPWLMKSWEENPEYKKRFAFLSEAKGVNGSPLIIFPKCPEFDDLHAQDLCNLLAQLTLMDSPCINVGFTLIIDRRNEPCTTVKNVLKRITSSFPANLQLVLVLKSLSTFEKLSFSVLVKNAANQFKGDVPFYSGHCDIAKTYITMFDLTKHVLSREKGARDVLILESLLDIYDYIEPFHLIPELQFMGENGQKRQVTTYNHLKVKPQCQVSQKINVSEIEGELQTLKAALENQLIHCESLQRERDEALLQGNNLKDCLKEMVEKHDEALQVIDQMNNEKISILMEMKKLEAETQQQLTKKNMDLEQANRAQIQLKSQFKDAEKQKQALMTALEEQLEHSKCTQEQHDEDFSLRNNLKDCLVEMQMNYSEVCLSNEHLNSEKSSLEMDPQPLHHNVKKKCGTSCGEVQDETCTTRRISQQGS